MPGLSCSTQDLHCRVWGLPCGMQDHFFSCGMQDLLVAATGIFSCGMQGL